MRGGMRRAITAVIAASAMLGLSGCAALLLIPTADQLSGASAGSSSGTGTPPVAVVPYSNGSRNAHGLIPKQVGDPAGVINPSGTDHSLSFTVTRLHDATTECSATPPAGMELLEVDVTGQLTAEAAADPELASVSFAADRWSYFATESQDPLAIVDGDSLCLGDEPSHSVVAGTGFTFTEYLLVPSLTGSVAFSLPGGTGWEWELGSSLR